MYNYLDPPAAAPGELGTIEPQRIIITRTTVRNTVDKTTNRPSNIAISL
ncbi:hypothetical protein [Bacteroides cellulosilyticus]|nr:hypothetical protein [Bacteroides cellulosilyticus]